MIINDLANVSQNQQMKTRQKDILLISILTIGILCLFLNDRLWKYEYGNLLTGKLSDFIGLFTFPLFLAILVPNIKQLISISIGVLFIFWKSPLSSQLIEKWNSYQIFELTRVIDKTDFIALLMIPLVHTLIMNYQITRVRTFLKESIPKVILVPALLLTTFIFCSTSVPEPAYPKGDILIEETYQLKNKTESQILNYFENQNLTINEDSIVYLRNNRTRNHKYYQIEKFIANTERGLDTLYKINFRIYENTDQSTVSIINLTVQKNWDLQNWETLKWKTKHYKKIIEQQIIKKINGI